MRPQPQPQAGRWPPCLRWILWTALLISAASSPIAAAHGAGGAARAQDCEDTADWTNGDASCMDQDEVLSGCTEAGATCEYFKHPRFYHLCDAGPGRPWQNCCVCGGGSAFDPKKKHTTTTPGPWMDGVKALSHEVYRGISSSDNGAPPAIEGGSVDEINTVVLRVLGFVATATLLGSAVDMLGWCRLRKGRPRWWAVALLVASYSLLVPGLVSTVFSFDIVVSIFGNRLDMQPDHDHAKSCTESVLGLILLLQRTGCPLGAAMVFFYAVAVPAAKLLLLLTGELLRFAEGPARVRLARRCVQVVQAISKWASPDMFAYVLLAHLVRVLDHPPTLLAGARLDAGFSCFAVFCVCSTVSSLGIGLPTPEGDKARTAELAAEARQPPLLAWCVGRRSGVAPVAIALAAIVVLLLWRGLVEPCMSLRIQEEQLYEPGGSLPYAAKPVVDALQIIPLLSSDVSIWSCIAKLADEVGSGGEANCILGLVLLAVFVVGLTILDMLLLVAASFRLCALEDERVRAGAVRGKGGGDEWRCPWRPQTARGCPFLRMANLCGKLSMLDVAVMGIYVITVCLSMYEEHGLVISVQRGAGVLLAAELVHKLAHWLVASAVEYHLEADYETAPGPRPDMLVVGTDGDAGVPLAVSAGCCHGPMGAKRRPAPISWLGACTPRGGLPGLPAAGPR